MGSDRIRVSPMPALRAPRAGLAAAVLALLAVPAAAPAATTQGGLDPGAGPTTPVSTGGTTYDTRPIVYGASGAVVRMIQKHLKLAGYSVPQTGRFQSGTERAIRRFQRDRKLSVTGMFDAR